MKQRTKEKIKKIRKEIKEEVKQDFLNVPNIITLSRLVLAFLVIYMIFTDYSRWAIAIVFAFAAATDWFDGYFARKLKQTSAIGARLDQVIDRIFTVIIVVALLIFFIQNNIKEVLFLVLIMSREIVSSFGVAIRLVRNMDAYRVKYIGKLTTFVQSVTIAILIVGFSWSIYPVIITSILGILAGLDYVKDSIS